MSEGCLIIRDGLYFALFFVAGAGVTATAQARPPRLNADLAEVRSPVQLEALKTEHLTDALGIETSQPRFSWWLKSAERGQLQTAYQVLVATSLERLQADSGDLW